MQGTNLNRTQVGSQPDRQQLKCAQESQRLICFWRLVGRHLQKEHRQSVKFLSVPPVCVAWPTYIDGDD
jgi:hypothetical protein